VASAVAGNGEQRAVSPRALSHSSCLGPESETSETDERHVYRRFSLDPRSVWKEDHRRDFLSEQRPSVNRHKLGLVSTSAASTVDRDESRNSERTRLQSGYISVAGTSNARTRTRMPRTYTRKVMRACTCGREAHNV